MPGDDGLRMFLRHRHVLHAIRPGSVGLISDACAIFVEVCNHPTPEFVVDLFASKPGDKELCWAEVKRRQIHLPGRAAYDLPPVLRINLALFLPMVPTEVVYSTLLEELIHLHRGFDLINPHDAVFLRMARRYPFYDDSELWKKYHAFEVLQELNEKVPNL